MGSEDLKWRQLAQNNLMSPQGPHFSHYSTAKTNFKKPNRRKIGILSSGISVVTFASVYSEKTRLKKLMIMIIITRTCKRAG